MNTFLPKAQIETVKFYQSSDVICMWPIQLLRLLILGMVKETIPASAFGDF